MNDNLKIKFTDRGLRILLDEDREHLPVKYWRGFNDLKLDKDGYYQMQMHQFLSTFGPLLSSAHDIADYMEFNLLIQYDAENL